MASFITAGNATNGLQVSSDNTGILELRTGTGSGTTAVTLSTAQAATFVAGITATTGSFSGDLSFNSGYGSSAVAYGCRAWVNFNGTGTVAIRASGNVTSITDYNVGDYGVNLTTAMPDINYSIACTIGGTSSAFAVRDFSDATGRTTSAFRIVCVTLAGASIDPAQVNASVFR